MALGGTIFAVHHARSEPDPQSSKNQRLAKHHVTQQPLTKHRRIEDDYEIGETLGEGAFAVVQVARCKRTGKKVAVKCIPTTKQTAERVRAELI